VSNLKVGMGVADLPKAIDTGITVALGTDGPASNNSLDMFETMKMASILAKGLHGDTTVMNSRQSFEAATSAAAHSLGQGNEIGAISPGMRADIVVMDLRKAHSTPIYDPYNYLVYTAKASDTRDVMIDGRVLMKDKAPLFVNLQRLKERVSKRLQASGLLPA
jgi:5-methylthioadenosine/S-adenosylhomocysteine deaminase